MIVIGVDPAKYGFDAAVIEVTADGEEMLTQTVTFRAAEKVFQLPSTALARTSAAVTELLFALHSSSPEEKIVVFCEEPVSAGARNLRTYGQMAMTVGAILSSTTLYTPNCYLVPVSRWKMVVVGKGNANKDQVTLWLNRVHPNYAARCGASQDLVDACCIARYGLTVLTDSGLVSHADDPGEV